MLPCSSSPIQPPFPVTAAAPWSVLVVEDNPACRAQWCHAIAAAPDLRLAGAADDLPLATWRLRRLRPDLLLTDIGLPSGSGLELIRLARREGLCREVMVVSIFGDDQLVLECLAAGAVGYVLKGGSNEDIATQVRQLRDGGSPMSPLIARRLLSHLSVPQPVSGQAALSAQERDVLAFVSKGCTYDEVAALMALSRHTVQTYVRRTYRKLQVHNKAEALFEARRQGLLP